MYLDLLWHLDAFLLILKGCHFNGISPQQIIPSGLNRNASSNELQILLQIMRMILALHSRGERIYYNLVFKYIWIVQTEYIQKPNYSPIFKKRIIFVFGRYFPTEFIRIRIRLLFLSKIYSYLYLVLFLNWIYLYSYSILFLNRIYSYSVVKILFAHLWIA